MSATIFISSVIFDAASSFTIAMRRLIHTVLVGALVLVAAFGQAETRESLELQQQQQSSSSNDQLQPDSNEKLKTVSSAELHEKAIDTLVSTTTEGLSISSDTSVEKDSPKTSDAGHRNDRVNVTANAEEPDDASLEMRSLDGKTKVIVPVNKETVTVEATAAQQAVNETASSDEVETTTVRIPVANRLPLSNRLTRLRTTTVRNVVSTSKDSDEESDLARRTTQPAKSGGGQAQQTDSGKRVFGRIRTTTAKSPTTTTAEDSKEDVVVATTTVRNSPSGSRFSRVRSTTTKTTVRAATTTTSASSEREDLISTARPTTVRSSAVNRFSRLRATTTTAATTILKDSGEQVEIVTPSPSTTTPRSPPRNRFNSFRGTTTSKPVARDSDEQIEKVDAIQTTTTTTTTARSFVPGNRFARLRTTTIGRSSTTTSANSDEEIEATTPRNLRPANRFSGRVRSTTTTARTTTVSKDSDELVDSGIVSTTTTARSSTRGNRFRFSGLKPTTTSAPSTTTRVSKGSDEQDDSVSGIQSTTARNSNLRNKFIRTKPVRVTTTTTAKDSSAEDVGNKNGIPKMNSASASSHTQVTTISAQISSDSGEDDKFVNGTLATTTARNLDSGEKIDSVNSNATQAAATTARSSIFLKYFNRYRTTKASQDHSDSSDEVEGVDRAINETSPTERQKFLNRLRTTAASIPPVTNLTAPATPSSETSNLGRKDRAIIYSSAKSDNQLITSTVSTAQVEIPSTTSAAAATTTTTTTTKRYYAFGSSDEMDDTSEDDDASRAPYFDPYYGVPLRETSAGVPPSPMEENSLEVDDVSSELEFNVTAKPDDHSSEVGMGEMVPTKVSDVQHAVYLRPNANGDVSVEVVFGVPSNQPYQQDVRNQTGMAQHGAHFVPAESDEGNEGSVEEKEGSGDVLEENANGQNSTMTAIQQETNPVKESDEGNEASMEKGTNGEVPDENSTGESNTTMKVDEPPQNSDENDDNSSLEIDLSKLTDIQRILTDVKTEEVTLPRVLPVTVTELPQFFTDAKPEVELILETENLTTTIPPVPATETRSQNDSLSRHLVSSDEVTTKLKELLANPMVQQRLEAIDGRLKSTKSARVKRLIEKYLAALAKLSNSGASASATSFSVFLPLLITCFLFGFS